MSSPIDYRMFDDEPVYGGLSFPDHARMPTAAAVFDDREIAGWIHVDGDDYVPLRQAERHLRVANGWLRREAVRGRVILHYVSYRPSRDGRLRRGWLIQPAELERVRQELTAQRERGEFVQPYPRQAVPPGEADKPAGSRPGTSASASVSPGWFAAGLRRLLGV